MRTLQITPGKKTFWVTLSFWVGFWLLCILLLSFFEHHGRVYASPSQYGHSCGSFSCDVPAVEIPAPSRLAYTPNCNDASNICSGELMVCTNHGTLIEGNNIAGCSHGYTLSCADKSRILMTAEDGKSWCHAPMVSE